VNDSSSRRKELLDLVRELISAGTERKRVPPGLDGSEHRPDIRLAAFAMCRVATAGIPSLGRHRVVSVLPSYTVRRHGL